MTAPAMFHGFDGLMTLSRREGVDVRPTLLRVLTDLYVQTSTHNFEEERHFVELTSRLIDEVDDATRAAVRSRLATYPNTPREIRRKLGIAPPRLSRRAQPAAPMQSSLEDDVTFTDERNIIEIADAPHTAPQIAPEPVSLIAPQADTAPRALPTLSMQPADAASLNDMFFAAGPKSRGEILHNLNSAPLTPSVRVDPKRAARALVTLEQAAMASDIPAFTAELADALILPAATTAQIVGDPQGEPLACAARALGMPGEIFQRVLLFLNPSIGSSVMDVYRLARLYDNLSERSALIMLAAWRGSAIAHARAKYRPAFYDDERQRTRGAPLKARPPHPGNSQQANFQSGNSQPANVRTPIHGSSGRQR